MKCPVCDGEGVFEEYIEYTLCDVYNCSCCNGTGKLSLFRWIEVWLWDNLPQRIVELWIDILLFFDKESEE